MTCGIRRRAWAAGHLTLPNVTGTDIFCSSQLVLAQSGNIFLAGGDNFVNGNTTNTGNNNTQRLHAHRQLARPRQQHEPRALVFELHHAAERRDLHPGRQRRRRPAGSARHGRRLSPAQRTRTRAASRPRSRATSSRRTRACSASIPAARCTTSRPAALACCTMAGQLPGATSWTSSAVMFQPGRILQIGGASSAALVIDINGATPVVTSTQSMSTQRQWVSATVLADGRVLGTGGSAVENQLNGVNNVAEIWNPDTGQWTQGSAGANARLYHSGALLLPDATVLISGGGAPGPLVNLNAEIYYPPYLFASTGGIAPRARASSRRPTPSFRARPFSSARPARAASAASRSSRRDRRPTASTWISASSSCRSPPWARCSTCSCRRGRPTLPPGYYMLFVLNGAGRALRRAHGARGHHCDQSSDRRRHAGHRRRGRRTVPAFLRCR